MSWYSKLLVAGVLGLGLSACGFQPMYAEQNGTPYSPVAAELAYVRVLPIKDRIGQQVRNGLVKRLSPSGEAGGPRYTLVVKLTQQTGSIVSSQDGDAALGNLTLNGAFSLISADEPKTLFSGRSLSVSSFRNFGPRYGSMSTEREAEQRAAQEMAEDIRNQIAAYFASRGAGFKPESGQ
jgi:LPS-assembly lipoprotein